jgi:hypothetical protein
VIGVTCIQTGLKLKTIEYSAACVALIGSNYVFKKHTPVKNSFVTFFLVSDTAKGEDFGSETGKDNVNVF